MDRAEGARCLNERRGEIVWKIIFWDRKDMNKHYLAKRDEYMLDKYQTRFGYRPRQMPKINVVLSGGGYRAAICSLALLVAFETHGLLDWVRSVASLSGSSWLIMSWMTHGVRLEELKEILKAKMKFQLFSCNQDIMSAIQLLTLKYKNGQPISLVDIWGAAIGNTFLPRPNMKLSDLQVEVEKAIYPFPTFAAIRNIGGHYEWLEFTPAELTFLQQGYIVPMNYINSLWAAGEVIKEYPEEPIESLLGIFGSAFCANFEDIKRICGTNPYRLVLFQTLGQLLDRFQLRHYRLARGQLLNPLFKFDPPTRSKPKPPPSVAPDMRMWSNARLSPRIHPNMCPGRAATLVGHLVGRSTMDGIDSNQNLSPSAAYSTAPDQTTTHGPVVERSNEIDIDPIIEIFDAGIDFNYPLVSALKQNPVYSYYM